MKQLFTTCILVLIALHASARLSGSMHYNANKKTTSTAVTYELKGGNMVFSGLSKKPTTIYVMRQDGTMEMSGTISKKHNAFDISKLCDGNHVIALKQGKDIKLFGYLAEIVVRANKAA